MSIRELFEKSFLLGLGTLALTRETAQRIVDDLVKKGQAQREEAEEFVERLVKRGEEERNALRKLVRDEIKQALSGLHLATKKDVDALSKKIDALTERLGKQ